MHRDDTDTRSMHERMLAGDLYIADDPEIAEAAAAGQDLMAAYNATTARQSGLRRVLLEQLLAAVGEGTQIRPPFYVDYGAHLSFGARTFANYGLVALDVAPIRVGDDVQIGPNVQLLTPTPGGAGNAPTEMGGRGTDHCGQQRLAGRRCDCARGSVHRVGRRRRGRSRRDA